MSEQDYFKGRGSQFNAHNRFSTHHYVSEHIEGLDEEFQQQPNTQVFFEQPKTIVNKVDSPDVGMAWSLNPYQGCEHGCIYCYARPTHEYWGFSAGLDFESKIIVKKNAAQILEQTLLKKSWKGDVISLSGNTDCYQPLERQYKLTRQLLEVLWKYRNPVGMITKNALILRDIDVLSDLAKENLVNVFISVTTTNEKLRQVLEPRTASIKMRLETIRRLTEAGVPCGAMIAPIIPGLTDHEIPSIMKKVAEAGALGVGYTVVRLNGAIGELFKDWVYKNFPDRADKIWRQVSEIHGGEVSDSHFGRRMRGEGPISGAINQLFHASKKKYLTGRSLPTLNTNAFRRAGNLNIFD